MSRKPPPPEGFSREESRYLDGEMPADAARRMEHRLAADPKRADAVDAYREAMDVWREDATRTPRGLGDTEAMADRVLASVTGDAPPRMSAARAAAPWYAAAAMLLITVGIAGTVLSRPDTASADTTPTGFVEFEEAMVNLLIDGPEFSPPLVRSEHSK